MKKIPMENGSMLIETEYNFEEDKIYIKSDVFDGNVDWKTIKSLEIGKKAIYLYIDRVIAYVIPKRVFSDTMQQEAFIQLIENKIR